MNRSIRDGSGRSRIGSGDYGSMRSFSAQGVMGTSPSGLLGHGMGGGYGGGGYEMDSLLQQRSLQQQLSLRESQLALANSLLQQQSHLMDGPGMGIRGGAGSLGLGGLGGGMLMNKRRQDLLQGDYQPDYKRPRSDYRSQPRDRYRGRDSDAGNRSFNSRRNQTSSRPYRSSDRDTSGKGKKDPKEEYDPEKPTTDEDEKNDGEKSKDNPDPKFYCHVCNTNCWDDDGFKRHMNSSRHKERMLGVLSIHKEKSSQIASRMKAEKHLRNLEDEDKIARGYCKICDIPLSTRYSDHQRLTFHRKRVLQVTKGCGWCGVSSFKNFSEVLAHRETDEHRQKQEENEKQDAKDSKNKKESQRRGGRNETKSPVKKRTPIKVEMPASLARFDSDTAVGQTCVVAVTGWFCKLCNKFYNNEAAAKETHCKTESHFGKYKRFVYAKLRAKAEADRDAAEKAAEEEEKKKAASDEQNPEKVVDETREKDDGEESTKDNLKVASDQEESMEEGGDKAEIGEETVEEDDNAVLAEDESAFDFMEDEDVEAEEDNLLKDSGQNSTYQTADDSALDEDHAEEGDDVETPSLSLIKKENISEISQVSNQADDLNTEDTKEVDDEEVESDSNVQDEEDSPESKRATRANVSPRSISTPARGRGRGVAPNRARRGRKLAK